MIKVKLNVLLAERGMSVQDFSAAVGITPANIAVLKNGRAKAIRFTTLAAICQALDCTVSDVLEYVPDGSAPEPAPKASAPDHASKEAGGSKQPPRGER